MSWTDQAACAGVDPDLFHPVPVGADLRNYPVTIWDDALAVCATCPVRAECLDYALSLPADQVDGVWGGTTPGQRKTLPRACAHCGERFDPIYRTRPQKYCTPACSAAAHRVQQVAYDRRQPGENYRCCGHDFGEDGVRFAAHRRQAHSLAVAG